MTHGTPPSVVCERCATPHRASLRECDECGHELGTPVDWSEVDAEIAALRNRSLLSFGASVLIAFGALLLTGGLLTLIAVAPAGVSAQSGYRYFALRAARTRARERSA